MLYYLGWRIGVGWTWSLEESWFGVGDVISGLLPHESNPAPPNLGPVQLHDTAAKHFSLLIHSTPPNISHYRKAAQV